MEDKYTSEKEEEDVQDGEEEEEENDDNDLIKDTPKKKNPNWRIEEDESLCKSWLNTSKDSITGNGQTSDSFWDRIHKRAADASVCPTPPIDAWDAFGDAPQASKAGVREAFVEKRVRGVRVWPGQVAACRTRTGRQTRPAVYLGLIDKVIEKKKAESHSKSKGPKGKGFKPFTTRNKKALESRWYHIQHQVSKYCGHFAQADRRLRSGSSLDAIAIEAKLLFKNEIGKKFGLDHCWGILHNAQKWLDHLNKANGRKSKNDNDNPSSVGDMSSTTEESRTGRPEGQKTAKKRKNEEITLDELVKGQRELLDISRQKVKSFESYIDNMIMCQSLEGMDQETLEFFQAKRRKAIANAKANT
ncbi:hypothetical protein MJO28_017386 [Puccinia striiformis f. sp. tritici]|nr:hypothetical protein MJO28_017386 [Puccinia striiformis f. sp. tritici]